MPSEMRRPGPIAIEGYIDRLDLRIRDEAGRNRHASLPSPAHMAARRLRALLRPLLQSGAMVLTSLAVIVAVGVAPGTLPTATHDNSSVAAPADPSSFIYEPNGFLDRIPDDEFLASEAVHVPDNPDTPQLGME